MLINQMISLSHLREANSMFSWFWWIRKDYKVCSNYFSVFPILRLKIFDLTKCCLAYLDCFRLKDNSIAILLLQKLLESVHERLIESLPARLWVIYYHLQHRIWTGILILITICAGALNSWQIFARKFVACLSSF